MKRPVEDPETARPPLQSDFSQGHFPTFSRWACEFLRSIASALAYGRRLGRRFPFSLRTLLIVVALSAVALAIPVIGRRAEAYRKKAEQYASGEAFHSRHIGKYAAKDPEWDWVIRQKAAYCAAMRQKYERAASRPWTAVAPDPPYPWETIMDRRFLEALERQIRKLKEKGDPYAESLIKVKREIEGRKPRSPAGPA